MKSRTPGWKILVALFFVLVLIEGVLRKWLFPQFSQPLYFAKDVVLILAAVSYMTRHRLGLPAAMRGSVFGAVIALYVWIVLLQGVNFRLPSISVGLLGIKTYGLYLLLLVLVPAAFPWDPAQQRRLARYYIIFFAIPITLLGIYQFFQPPGHWINAYVGEGAVATVGQEGFARVTGTFTFITGMTTFLFVNLGLGIGMLWGSTRDYRWYIPGLVLLGLTLIVGPMNGSRAFVALPLLALPFLLVDALKRPVAARRSGLAVIVVLVAASALGSAGFTQGWTALAERAETAGDTETRFKDTALGPFKRAFRSGPLGYGSGSTHQAAPLLVPNRPAYDWLPNTRFEEENGRVAMELGWIGFVIYLLLKAMAVWLAFKVLRGADTSVGRAIGAGGLIIMCVHTVASTIFNVTAAAFYWGTLGLLIFERSKQMAAKAEPVRAGRGPLAGLRFGG